MVKKKIIKESYWVNIDMYDNPLCKKCYEWNYPEVKLYSCKTVDPIEKCYCAICGKIIKIKN